MIGSCKVKETNQSTAVVSEPMAIQPAIACQNGRGGWLYNSPPASASQISSKEATEHAVYSTARNSTRSHISGTEVTKVTDYVPFRYFTRTVSMGTSSITPCYDVERLETKTHVGLGPGESISAGWALRVTRGWGVVPKVILGVHTIMDRPSKEGLEKCRSSEPKKIAI